MLRRRARHAVEHTARSIVTSLRSRFRSNETRSQAASFVVPVEGLEQRVLMARVEGIDVSQFQGTINWNQVRDAGKEFAFVRSTIGNSAGSPNIDTRFHVNMSEGAAAGLLMGAYHRAKPDASANDAVNEANWFLQNAQQYMTSGWLRPVVDIEHTDVGGLNQAAVSAWVNTFSDTVEAAIGVPPIIYGNTTTVTSLLNTTVSAGNDLWLGRYNTGTVNPQSDQPQTPSGFSNPYGSWNVPLGGAPSHNSWDFWQYTNQGTLPGLPPNTHVDLDVFQGDRATLESQFVFAHPQQQKFQLAVKFGPYEANTISGYINFGEQTLTNVLGYQMGWDVTAPVPVAPSGGTAPDQRYKSYIFPNTFGGATRKFEVAVPNGSYRVRVVAGSPTEFGNTHNFAAEGVTVVNAVNNSTNKFVSGVQTVTVSDGLLTISSGTSFSRLMFIDVVDASRVGSPPVAPANIAATPASTTAVDVRWLDRADNEGRDPTTFGPTTWGQVNEGYKIERRQLDGGAWSSWSTPRYARANAEMFQDTGLTAGKQYQYRVTAINGAGASAPVLSQPVTTPTSDAQQAYSATGAPWPVGTIIQAEDFDRGGQGTSFNDLSPGTAGGFYRDGGMDLGRIGAGTQGAPKSPREHRVGWFRPGEWLEYTVDVPAAGQYTMSFRVSVPGSGAKFYATTQAGGGETNLAASSPGGRWEVPNTGDWNLFATVVKTVSLPAGQQVLRVYADTPASTNPGVMDFDWLTITPMADLSVTGLAEADEQNVGGYVLLNDGFSEGNLGRNSEPRRDNEPDQTAGHRISGANSRLRDAQITLDGTPGRWKLTFPDRIIVWREVAPGTYTRVTSGTESELISSAQVVNLKVEGIQGSTQRRDVGLSLTFTPTTGSALQDAVSLTVAGVDADVDSDNDNLYDLPDLDNAEDRLEDDESKPGKTVYIGDTKRARMVVLGDLPAGDLANAKVRISYSAAAPGAPSGGGHLRLWRSGTSTAAGDYLAPGEYTGAQLGLGAGGQKHVQLYLEGVNATTDAASRRITIEVDPDGAGNQTAYDLRDALLVTVANRPVEGIIRGYKWDDVNGNAERDSELVKTPPNTVFVIDVSGSTERPYIGEGPVGDVNGDGLFDTVLDGQIQAFLNLNDYLQQNHPTTKVGIVVFGSSGKILDLDLSTATTPDATLSPGAKVRDRLLQINVAEDGVGETTNYEAGLRQAVNLGRRLLESGRRLNVFFLSDGFPSPDDNPERYMDEVAILRGPEFGRWGLNDMGANLRAFGAGQNASLEHLLNIDRNAVKFQTSGPLLDAFSGSVGTGEVFSEYTISGWTITAFADPNNNQQLDPGEQSWTTVTGADGYYTFSNLPAGTYVVREELKAGWVQKYPTPNIHVVPVTPGTEAVAHFGNQIGGRANLVVDSDNNDGAGRPDNTPREEELEQFQGKDIYVNRSDPDGDGLLGYADLDSAGTIFTQALVDLSGLATVDLTGATVRFQYSGSDPAKISGNTPASGYLRLWTKEGGVARAVADYLAPNKDYSLAALGITPANLIGTIWMEGVAKTPSMFDGAITLTVDLDGSSVSNFTLNDIAHVKVDEVIHGSGTVTGHFFRDRNRNTQWDQQLILGDNPDVVMLLDASGSTVEVGMAGVGVGDINKDGAFGGQTTVLDAEIAGYIALNRQLIDLGFGSTASVAVVPFGLNLLPLDFRPDIPGNQNATTPAADLYPRNGIPDVEDALLGVRHDTNYGTRPQHPIRAAIDTLNAWGTAPEDSNVFLLSDGYYEPTLFAAEQQELLARGGNVRGYAVGRISTIANLRKFDPQASRLLGVDDILGALAGLGAGGATEEALSGWTAFHDVNTNDMLDGGEPSAATGADGSYTITGVAAGQNIMIKMVQQTGWLQTAPRIAPPDAEDYSNAEYFYRVSLDDGQTLSKLNFGVIEDRPAPTSDGLVFEPNPQGEGSPVRARLANPNGFTDNGQFPLVYSWDLNNDGDFLDRGEIYRSVSPTSSLTVDDGPTTLPAGSVRVRIHDAIGNVTDVLSTDTVTIRNEKPALLIRGLAKTYDLEALYNEDGELVGTGIAGVILDPSQGDTQATFRYEWVVKKGATEVYRTSGTTPANNPNASFGFVPEEGAGEYTITFRALDKDGDQSDPSDWGSVTATTTVRQTAPIISSLTADPEPVTTDRTTLTVVAGDDAGEATLRYYWEVDRPQHVVPEDLDVVGTNAAKVLPVRFLDDGTYNFTVWAVDEEGHFDSQEIAVDVVATPAAIRITPRSVPVPAGGSPQQFSVLSVDQFGRPITAPAGSVSWQVVGSNPLGSFDPNVPGLYLPPAAGTYGTDTVQATLGSLPAATAQAVIPDPASYAIVGGAPSYTATEGATVGTTDTASNEPIAQFIDTRPGTGGTYAATVDWDWHTGDPPSEAVGATVASRTIDGVLVHEVYASHMYSADGNFTFRVTLAHTEPGQPSRTGTANGAVAVAPGRAGAYVVEFNPVVNVQYSGAVLRFVSQDPTDTAAQFKAHITWGDPSTKELNVPAVASQQFPGVFEIHSAHTYTSNGAKTVTIELFKDGVPAPGAETVTGQIYVRSQPLAAPVIETAFQVSSSQLGITFNKVPGATGYYVWVQNKKTGAKTRSFTRGTPTAHDPVNTLYYVEQYLSPGTTYLYTVQSIDADGFPSAESAPFEGSTPGGKVVAQPTGLVGRHQLADVGGAGGAQEGVELRWTPDQGIDGYRVFRKVVPTDGSPAYWLDLVDPAGGTTPAANPDWEATITPDEDVLDPTKAENGLMSWFDPLTLSTAAEYAVVAYDGTNDPQNPIASSEPALLTVARDTNAPSTPANVRAASYPDAIQLTWDDRPVSEDEDWAGWRVRRFNPANGQWEQLHSRLLTGETGFNDLSAAIGQTSKYRVTSVDVFGNESAPAEVEHRRSIGGEPPVPTGVVGRSDGVGTDGKGRILLSWDHVTPVQHLGRTGDTRKGYDVARRTGTNPETWTSVRANSAADGDANSVTEAGLNLLSAFTYRVRTVDVDGDFSPWVVVDATTGNGIAPQQPTLVSQAHQGPASIRLEWQAAPGTPATTGFRVLRSTQPDAGFAPVAAYTNPTATVLIDTGLGASTTYYYRIYASDAEGDLSQPRTVTQSTEVVAEAPPVLKVGAMGGDPAVISADAKVFGVVDDPNNNLQSWTLFLRPLNPTGADGDFVVATGTAEVGQAPDQFGPLGTLQPTLIPNGNYTLVLRGREMPTVAHPDGRLTEHAAPGVVQIKTDAKLGNFTLPVVDLEVDVPGGMPITVTRVYDSSRAGDKGDFSYGWKLELSDANLSTTARKSERDDDVQSLRYGDAVYITLPGGQQHTFQFLPHPDPHDYAIGSTGYARAVDPLDQWYALSTYWPTFVSVDGSGAKLEIDYDGGLTYDRTNKEFIGALNNVPFDPASSAFGNKLYHVKTTDGSRHTINAATGKTVSSEDPNGNVTNYNSGQVDSGNQTVTIHRGEGGRIEWISTDPSGTGPKVQYVYSEYVRDSAGNIIGGGDLIEVIDPSGRSTKYRYEDTRRQHLLTKVIDGRGVEAVKVTYDAAGKASSATGAAGGKPAVLGYSGFDGRTGSSDVTDPTGGKVEQVFDDRGNVVREISAVRDSQGNVLRYRVTLRAYNYRPAPTLGDITDIIETGASYIGRLTSLTEYQSVETTDADPAGRRYTATAAELGAKLASRTTFHFPENPASADAGMLASQTVLAPDGVTELTTTFANYVKGKPGTITDPSGNVTVNTYDPDTGNLVKTTNPSGEETHFTYTPGANGVPKGLSLETYQFRPDGPDADAEPERIVLSANTYYEGNAAPRDLGRLRTTTNAAGLTTRYTYTETGQTKEVFREWADPTAPGGKRVVRDSLTDYDKAGRVWKVTDADGKFTETIFDENGKVLVSIDRFGGETVNAYDARGNLIRTRHADGTETRTAYDDLGRAVWTTDRFASSSSYTFTRSTEPGRGIVAWTSTDNASRTVGTQTVYDGLGRVTETRRHKDVAIRLEEDPAVNLSAGHGILRASTAREIVRSQAATVRLVAWDTVTRAPYTGALAGLAVTVAKNGGASAAATNAATRPADGSVEVVLTSGETDADHLSVAATTTTANVAIFPLHLVTGLISKTSSVFDSNGRAVETVNADGLRVGTVYRPDGRVHFTGPLEDNAPLKSKGQATNWYEASSNLTDYFRQQDGHRLVTTYDYDPTHLSVLDVAGTIEAGDKFVVTLNNPDGTSPQKLTFQASAGRTSPEQVAEDLVTAINGDARSLFNLVEAIADGASVRVSPNAANPTFRFRVDVATAESNDGVTDGQRLARRSISVVTDAMGRSTTQEQSGTGRESRTTFADGSFIRKIRDTYGLRTRSVDVLGRVTEEEFDAAGRLAAVTLPPVRIDDPQSPGTPIDVRPRYEYAYDAIGNQTSETTNAYLKADGQTVVYLRKPAVGGADQVVATRTLGQPLPAPATTTSTRFGYDARGRRVLRTLPLGQVERFGYDPQTGQQTLHVSFEGRVARSVYENTPAGGGRPDELHFFPTEAAYNNGTGTPEQTVVHHYDAMGRLESLEDSLAGTWTYGYDAEGRRTMTQGPAGVGTVRHEYDAAGRLNRTYTGAADPTRTSGAGDGKAVTDTRYTYDDYGRLETVTVYERNDAPLASAETTTHGYDAVGNLDWITQVNGVTSDYVYDPLMHRLTSLTHFVDGDLDKAFDAGEAVKNRFVYELNGDGTRKQATESADGEPTRTFHWAYDNLNRLVSEVLDVAGGESEDYVHLYQMDLTGNRLGKRVDDAPAAAMLAAFVAGTATLTPDDLTSYVYDANDRLWSEVFNSANDPEDTKTVYAYGPTNGLTEQTGKTVYPGLAAQGTPSEQHAFAYDVQGRMKHAAVTKANVTTVSEFKYAADGARIEQKVTEGGSAPKTTAYLVDGNNLTGHAQVLEERVNGTLDRTYTIGHDVIAQTAPTAASGVTLPPGVSAGDTLTFLYDGHGSTRAIIKGTAVVQRMAYDAYGNALAAVGLTTAGTLTSLLFTGEQTDRATGLQYLRARYYDPASGRFGRSDPYSGTLTDPATLHKYIYGHANPVTNIDPSGMISLPGLLVSMGISSVLGAMLAPVVRPAAEYLGGMVADSLLGHMVGQMVDVISGAPPAVMLGADFMLGGGFGGGSITGGISLELLLSPQFTASYFAVNFLSISAGKSGTGWVGSAQGKAGLVFGAENPAEYAEWFMSLTVPIKTLPQKLRDKVVEWSGSVVGLVGAAATGVPSLGPAAQRWDKVLSEGYDEVKRLAGDLSWLNTAITNSKNAGSYVTIFWDPTDADPIGFDFAAGWGNTGSVSLTGSYYWQLPG